VGDQGRLAVVEEQVGQALVRGVVAHGRL
jgi:hypothetical protein